MLSPVDSASLVVFRVCFGLLMLHEAWKYLSYGWLQSYIDEGFHFTYFGFEWLRPWPGQGMIIHFYVLGGLGLAIALGLFYRLATALFFVGFTYFFLLDQAYYLNHFYLICLVSFLLIIVPAHRYLSLDALLFPKIRSATVPAWSLWLLRAQIGVVYFYGGIAKINRDWLTGEPVRTWLSRGTIELPLLGPDVDPHYLAYFLCYGGLLLDLCIVPALLWRPTRIPALVVGSLFHLTNSQMFNIGVFPWLMIPATLLFLSPDWPRRLRLMPRLKEKDGDAAPPPVTPWRRRVLVSFLATYLAVQVVLPLRHFLYPGNPSWTEEGHLFAWHMMLRTKWSEAYFFVTDPEENKTWETFPHQVLSPRHMRKMSSRPYMIVQWAHYLADEIRSNGHRDVEIRALVIASLNNHPARLLIDPRVDLTQERRSVRPATWILREDDPLSDPATGIVMEVPRTVGQAFARALRRDLVRDYAWEVGGQLLSQPAATPSPGSRR